MSSKIRQILNWWVRFGLALELSDVDLLNIDLLDTHLDLLDTGIPSKYFVFLHNVFKTLQDMSSRHLQDMPSRPLQDMSSRRLEDQQMFAGFVIKSIYEWSVKKCKFVQVLSHSDENVQS